MMSKIFYSLKLTFIYVIMFVSAVAFGQSENNFFNALKNNDTASLEVYLQDQIDLCIIDNQQILNKSTAINKLSTFLSSHKITAIEVLHKGNSKDKSSQYKVAKLTTAGGPFRVFVYSTSQEMGPKTVKEIRIDKF